jgi:hypothetical protein
MGNVYVVGSAGSFGGGFDAYLRKFAASGGEVDRAIWNRDDEVYGVSTDRLGNIYNVAATRRDLGDECRRTRRVSGKIDASGNNLFTTNLAPAASAMNLSRAMITRTAYLLTS